MLKDCEQVGGEKHDPEKIIIRKSNIVLLNEMEVLWQIYPHHKFSV